MAQPLSSSSSSLREGGGRGAKRSVNDSDKLVPFPSPLRKEDEDDNALRWARDLDDLRAKLCDQLKLHPVDAESALRDYPAAKVEGAALKTIHLTTRGVVRRSIEGFFFTTLRRKLWWGPREVESYLRAEAAEEAGGDAFHRQKHRQSLKAGKPCIVCGGEEALR